MDEALRRTGQDRDTRALLLAIAERMTAVRPDEPMTGSRRLALALRYTSEAHGFTADAEAAERELLRYMPTVDQPISRGEYALRLRAAARGA
ncbi:hypothetical protein ACFRKB_11340 [Streptomyces scopuliridis]|uniref:hypothetical protein n=1 Tax=Streptomyces scopuliridis TaxID=452529 RepID=UPI0036B8393D